MKRLLLIALLPVSIHVSAGDRLKDGVYRGMLYLDSATVLPFNFDLKHESGKPLIVIRNSTERIPVDEVDVNGDSAVIRLPVFDTEFRVKLTETGMEGLWINNYRKDHNRIRFVALHGESSRFPIAPGVDASSFEGRWEASFSPGRRDSSKAVGVFRDQGSQLVEGTFLTETGDYRFLDGLRQGDSLKLSAFDGSHAFLFLAKKETDGTISGMFYSGSHWREPWRAKRNNTFQLRDAEALTRVIPGQKIAFAFADATGKTVSLDDEEYRNKPVVIQLMGSWCPNCMDESRFLNGFYEQYRSKGLAVVALAFEKTSDPQVSARQVSRMAKRLKLGYPVLITGTSGKEGAWRALPWLSEISAFPTTIFLDRHHEPVRVHTGFSGPATGDAYVAFAKSVDSLIKRLLKQ